MLKTSGYKRDNNDERKLEIRSRMLQAIHYGDLLKLSTNRPYEKA